jgi:nucleoside-diphosphate kinase
MLKPDAVHRGLVGEIITRFERRGLKLVALKLIRISKELAAEQYAEHKGKPFYDGLLKYVTSGPVVIMTLEGDRAVSIVREMMGKTDPGESPPGSIRGDYALQLGRNIIHGSDKLETAKREIALFFKPEDFVEYKRADEEWVYE